MKQLRRRALNSLRKIQNYCNSNRTIAPAERKVSPAPAHIVLPLKISTRIHRSVDGCKAVKVVNENVRNLKSKSCDARLTKQFRQCLSRIVIYTPEAEALLDSMVNGNNTLSDLTQESIENEQIECTPDENYDAESDPDNF